MTARKILITSALPYANGPLHFGHIAGAYLPADCYARFQRLLGNDVLYICGSDEYGIAITLSAEVAGHTPKQHVDLYHAINRDFFQQLNISFDHFSRTTWHGHNETTQEFFHELLANGYIEEKVTDQLYSEKDHRFLADRYVVGTCPKCGFTEARGDECQKCGSSYEATDLINPRSKISGAPLIRKATKHWFLRFDLFKDKLKKWIQDKKWKPNVLNFASHYVDDLHPRAITRDSDWGIPVPLKEAEGKVFYVWFDAPIGYISATKDWALNVKKSPDAWKDYWFDPKTTLVHFIGKDNIPFHAVFFPAMCMGQDQPIKLVDELPANEFYNLEGRQFSKSEGWMIDLESFFHKFTSDQIRYAIASNAPESQDAEFSWKDFQSRCNAELLGKYGNLANRVLVFLRSHFNGLVPTCDQPEEQDKTFVKRIHSLANEAKAAYSEFHVRRASQIVMELAQTANVYFDAKKPWVLAKNPEMRQELSNTMHACLDCLKVLALISYPIIPQTAEKLWSYLGFSQPLKEQIWDHVMSHPIPSGQATRSGDVLFQKIEDELIVLEIAKLDELRNKLGKKVQPEIARPYESLKPSIAIDEVRKLDLRVAEILKVERIPKSKKLLKLTVSLGFEERTVVSGIGDKIPDIESLIGKKIALVANLTPATLLGVESQGMVLAAEGSYGMELPTFPQAKAGDSIS